MKTFSRIIFLTGLLVFSSLHSVFSQEGFRWYHDYELTAFSGNLALEKTPGYRVDILGVKRNYLNMGLYSVFYPQMVGIKVPANGSLIGTGYLFPLGINYPFRIDKNFRSGIISRYYWTRKPHLLELEYRYERQYYSAFAGFRYNFQDPSLVKGIYAGLSFDLNIFFNFREMTESKRDEILTSICTAESPGCMALGYSKKEALLVGANLREGLEPSSTVYYLEDHLKNSNSLDSLCQLRSREILGRIKEQVPAEGIRTVKLMIFYGSVSRQKTYDQGGFSVLRVYPKNSNPRYADDYSGFTRNILQFGVTPLYTVEMDMRKLKEAGLPAGQLSPPDAEVKSETGIYLKDLKKAGGK